jgi:hypothetical protein
VRISLLLLALWIAAVSRCEEPVPKAPGPEPRPGDAVRIRGTLGEDVDCRVLYADNGKTYSLSVRLRGYPNSSKICVQGTLVEVTQCMTTPMIDVQSIRALSYCP